MKARFWGCCSSPKIFPALCARFFVQGGSDPPLPPGKYEFWYIFVHFFQKKNVQKHNFGIVVQAPKIFQFFFSMKGRPGRVQRRGCQSIATPVRLNTARPSPPPRAKLTPDLDCPRALSGSSAPSIGRRPSPLSRLIFRGIQANQIDLGVWLGPPAKFPQAPRAFGPRTDEIWRGVALSAHYVLPHLVFLTRHGNFLPQVPQP